MLAEINFCSDQLNLPVKHPIDEADLRNEMVLEPVGVIGFGGRLDTSDYFFSFLESGRLRLIERLHMWDGPSVMEREEQLALIQSVIDTNGAYLVARNGLAAIDVDVDRLGREQPVNVEQRSFYSSIKGESHLILLPIFDVKWGNWARPVISAVVAGNSGDLLALRQLDQSFSRRPRDIITNVDGLLAIPDAEFLKYTSEQRANLLTRFLSVTYPTQKRLPARPILPYITLTSTNGTIPLQTTNASGAQ